MFSLGKRLRQGVLPEKSKLPAAAQGLFKSLRAGSTFAQFVSAKTMHNIKSHLNIIYLFSINSLCKASTPICTKSSFTKTEILISEVETSNILIPCFAKI